MISIIICSRTQFISAYLSTNIENTIGSIDYELIIIDNSKNRYSIFEAYNIGIKKSKGNFLCFLHDDIYIHTNNWGEIINRIFKEDIKTGLIGIAGSKIKTKMPSAWWDCPEDQYVIYLLQHFKEKKKKLLSYGFQDTTCHEVAVVDGVFMAMRNDKRLFFSNMITGFHNYDINISFECQNLGYKVIVVNEILIEHFSIGTINDSWYESTYKLYEIYRRNMPVFSVCNLDMNELEFKNGARFVNKMLDLGKYKIAIKIWFKLFQLKPISRFHFRFIKQIIKRC